MKTVLPQLTSITGREARSLYFCLQPVLVASALILLVPTSLCYMTQTGEYYLGFALSYLTQSLQEPAGGSSSHGSCAPYWSDEASIRIPIHYGGERRRTNAGARCAEAASRSAGHSTRTATITKRYVCISHPENDYLLMCMAREAANKEELLEMITHGAEKIVNSTESYDFAPIPLWLLHVF